MTETIDSQTDPKRARILQSAMKVFLAYGFSRATMDDIAKAAQMSRPALYLQFKNKSEIFRALATIMLEQSVEAAKAALAEDGSFADRVFGALDIAVIGMLKTIEDSPHGSEILDQKSLAADLFEVWRGQLSALIAIAIKAEAERTGVNLSARALAPGAMADLIMDGIEGMKARVANLSEKREAIRGLVKVFALALQP